MHTGTQYAGNTTAQFVTFVANLRRLRGAQQLGVLEETPELTFPPVQECRVQGMHTHLPSPPNTVTVAAHGRPYAGHVLHLGGNLQQVQRMCRDGWSLGLRLFPRIECWRSLNLKFPAFTRV